MNELFTKLKAADQYIRVRTTCTKVIALVFCITVLMCSLFLTNVKNTLADPGGPFPTGKAIVFISQGQNSTSTMLYTATQYATGNAELNPSSQAYPPVYNATAFNENDMYLYAIQFNGTANTDPVLVRIGQDGYTTQIGSISGMVKYGVTGGITNSNYNAGVIGTGKYANTYFVHTAQNTNILYEIDLTNVNTKPLTATVVKLDANVQNTADLVFKDGYIWGFYNYNSAGSGTDVDNTFYRIDPDTLHVDVISTTQLKALPLVHDQYGAQWSYGNGNIGICDNNPTNDPNKGFLYQIKIDNPGGPPNEADGTPQNPTPTFSIVSSMRSPSTNQNDAASYVGIPIDLRMDKGGPAMFTAGGEMTYELTITNTETDPTLTSSGYVVRDELPAQLLNPTCDDPNVDIVNTGGVNVLTYTGGELAPATSFTITVKGNTSPDAATEIVNTATVIGNEYDPNPYNDMDTVVSQPVVGGPQQIGGAEMKYTGYDMADIVNGNFDMGSALASGAGNQKYDGAAYVNGSVWYTPFGSDTVMQQDAVTGAITGWPLSGMKDFITGDVVTGDTSIT
ncbi:MAG: DUF11 domain-containing protein, partial [Clostridiales bacterium]|nr:DUF11 domain-containing protein [Clostridiales bacterium]